MTGVEFMPAAAKAGAGLVGPAAGEFWKRVRPDVSYASLTGYSDALADAVQRRETGVLDELRGGPDTFMDLEVWAYVRPTEDEMRSRSYWDERPFDEARKRFPDLERMMEVFRRGRRPYHQEPTDYRNPGASVYHEDPDHFVYRGPTAVLRLHRFGDFLRGRTQPSRLMVLGDAGSGKTVAAIHFLLDQLRWRSNTPDSVRVGIPVPVRVNANGWDGRGQLSMWLTDRLSINYGLHPRIARALVDSGRILPVIDGLDEMDWRPGVLEHAGHVLDRLNEPPWRNRPVVVTCRTDEFMELKHRQGDSGLHGAWTVVMQPATPDAIDGYLHHYQAQIGATHKVWQETLRAIHPSSGLAAALSNPWILSLMATALHRQPDWILDNRTTLFDGSREQISEKLLESVVPTAIAGTLRSGESLSYTAENVHAWLAKLASAAHDSEISLDRLWLLAGPRRCQMVWTGTAALAVAIVAGPILTVIIGGPGGFAAGILTVTALLGSPFVPFEASWSTRPGTGGHARRVAWSVPGRRRWPRGLVFGTAAGLLLGGSAWLTTWLTFIPKLMIPTAVGAVVAAASGLGIGVLVAVQTSSADRLTLGQDERRVISDDWRTGLAATAVAVLIAGLLAAVFITDWSDTGAPARSIAESILLGLGIGLAVGICVFCTVAAASGRYVVARLMFRYISKDFAPRPASFLDWARRSGLLRVTGISYQFRHDTFRAWLSEGSTRS